MILRDVTLYALAASWSLSCSQADDAQVAAESVPADVAPPPAAGAPRTGRFETGKVVSDTFEIRHHLDGRTLTFVLVTDLPDNTDLMVGVRRRYKERGSAEDYSIDFFSEKSKVGAWRSPHQITLDNDAWTAKLEEQQRIMARVGEPFEVRSIADDVLISLTVPVNQPDPRFGQRNANLVGAVVEQSGTLRIIDIERSIPYPREGEIRNPAWADPLRLGVNETYVLGTRVPLMPELNPVDPIAAVERMVDLPGGSRITVREVRFQGGTPWYRVDAHAADGNSLGSGWVNSIALIGQDVRKVSEGP